jgi:hypothetical protein
VKHVAALSLGTGLFLLITRGAAAQTYYQDGDVHTLNSALPVGAAVVSQQTTLNVQAGANVVGNSILGATNTAQLPNTGCWAFGVEAFESNVNIYGGTITGATSNIIGCWSTGIDADSGSTVNVYGGTIVGANNQAGYAADVETLGATVNIQGGTFTGGSGLDDFQAVSGGVINFHHGQFDSGSGIQNIGGLVDIFGGNFNGAANLQMLGGTLNLYGSGFNYPLGPISATGGTITGNLADGSPFTANFSQSSPGQIIINPVPEPATLAVLGVAGFSFLMRRKQPSTASGAASRHRMRCL